MKKFIDFVKAHPMMVALWVMSAVAMIVGGGECGVIMAMAAAAAPEMNAADPVASGSPTAVEGSAGHDTQLDGHATTVSNMSEASDIIEPDVDEIITQIASDESIIDTIKRRVKRQVQVKSQEVDHYLIDEKPATITVATATTSAKSRATLSFEKEGGKLVKPYYTAVAKSIEGYDKDGTKKNGLPLMLLCTGEDSSTGDPVFIALNGSKSSPADEYSQVPAIAAGSEFLLCSSMGYETQKFIAPSTVVPVPERIYLQKQICNSIVSDYYNAQKKRIPFAESVIAEAILRQYRLESCRTAWFGVGSKIKVKAQDPSLGEQWAYSSTGIRWQFKRTYDALTLNSEGKLDFDAITDLLMNYFTTFASSKKAVWLMGKELLAAIQKIDFTAHIDVTMSDSKVWGIAASKLHTVFGDVQLVHDPTLDRFGYEWQGGLIDENGLVRYYMKNEEHKKESVYGEEAKRDIVMTIDALCLKGMNHMWVNGEGLKA